jgi:hypothetical protein
MMPDGGREPPAAVQPDGWLPAVRLAEAIAEFTGDPARAKAVVAALLHQPLDGFDQAHRQVARAVRSGIDGGTVPMRWTEDVRAWREQPGQRPLYRHDAADQGGLLSIAPTVDAFLPLPTAGGPVLTPPKTRLNAATGQVEAWRTWTLRIDSAPRFATANKSGWLPVGSVEVRWDELAGLLPATPVAKQPPAGDVPAVARTNSRGDKHVAHMAGSEQGRTVYAPRGKDPELLDRAETWMQDHFSQAADRWDKRAQAVTACMKATTCTKNQAIAAWKAHAPAAARKGGRPARGKP